jgi:outer membrane protein, multidrug efflux system
LLQQRDAAVQLQAQALSTDLSLIKALGGGYRADEPAAADAQTPSSSVTAGAVDHERH